MSISQLLEKHIDIRRLTQEEIASAVGVGRSTVGNWKTGERPIDLKYLSPLADALGLNDAEKAAFISEGERSFAENKGTLELLEMERKRVQKLERLVLSLHEQLDECRGQAGQSAHPKS